MNISKFARTLAAVAVAVALVPAVQGQEKSDKEKKVTRTVVVKDGKVWTSNSPGFVYSDGPGNVFWVGARGFLGVQTFELTPELREHFKVSKDAGVLVGKVVADSPAAKAGIRVGDIITAIDGGKVDSGFDVARAVRSKKNGESVKIEYSRDGANGTAIATMTERERKEIDLREFNVRVPDIQIPDVGKHMEEVFNSPEWKAKMERLRDLPDCSEMQQKLKQLDTKLKELEKKLPK